LEVKVKLTRNKVPICHFCNLPGHWKCQCRKYLQNKKIKKTNKETSKSYDGNAFVTGTVNTNNIEESWLVDSGASDDRSYV